MRTMWIAGLLVILLVSQAFCRPDNYGQSADDDYPDDPPQEYDEEEGEDDNESNSPPLGPPEIKTKPLMLEVRPGGNVELPCVLVNADEIANAWKKGEESLFFGDTRTTQNPRIVRTSNNSLIIYNVTEEDSSEEYICQILTEPKTIEVVHHLRVVSKPKEPKDHGDSQHNQHPIRPVPGRRVEVNENEEVTFGCEIKQKPLPSIKWSHKGERLHNGEQIDPTGQFITIKEATRHHSGRYQCLADDGSDKLPHDSIEVSVKYAPVVEAVHEIVHSGTMMTAHLTCKVHAHPRAEVTWLKNQKQIKNKKDSKKFTTSEEKSLRILTIEHITKHDFGTYTCHAMNPMGEASAEIILSGTPAKPKFIGGEIADDEKSMILKWHVESFSPITEYKLDYRLKGESEWTSVSPNVVDGKSDLFTVEYALENLQPDGSYEATLVARNAFGWSPSSAIQQFNKEYVSDEPQNVKGEKNVADSTTSRPLVALSVALLVLSSYISTYF